MSERFCYLFVASAVPSSTIILSKCVSMRQTQTEPHSTERTAKVHDEFEDQKKRKRKRTRKKTTTLITESHSIYLSPSDRKLHSLPSISLLLFHFNVFSLELTTFSHRKWQNLKEKKRNKKLNGKMFCVAQISVPQFLLRFVCVCMCVWVLMFNENLTDATHSPFHSLVTDTS